MSTDLSEKPATTAAAAQHVHPPWRNALELGPVLAGVVFAVGCLANMARLPWLAVVVLACALAAGLTAASALMARTGLGAVWGAAASACAAGWDAYAAIVSPWSWPAVTGLIVPALLFTPLWPALKEHEHRLAEAERRRLAALEAAKGAKRWPSLLDKISQKGTRYIGETETKAGYDVELQLPSTGRVTLKTLASSLHQLEIAAKVRAGSLSFERLPGMDAHKVILHVTTKDFLGEIIPFPIPTRRRSINDPVPVGVFEDGEIAYLTLREICVLIVALRGKGKSNLLNVLIANLAFCVDVVIFVIDHKHRLARLWIQPWLDGENTRPIIDWVATTPEETDIMLDALERGGKARTSAGDGKEKITPSIKQPAVLLVCDEMAVVFGQNMGGYRNSQEGPTNTSLARKAKKITVLYRSEAFDAVYATQRGTVTMSGDGDLKSQCDTRIGLGVSTEADARLIMPDDQIAIKNLARLSEPGCAILWRKNGRVQPFKVFRITGDDIAEVCRRAHLWRPAPDPLLEEAFGDPYRERWSHRGQYLLPGGGQPKMGVVAPPGMDEDEFERIVRTKLYDVDVPMPDDDAQASGARKAYREYAKRRGTTGFSVSQVVRTLEAKGMPVSRQTVHNWLNEDLALGLVEKLGEFGKWRWCGGL